MFGKDQCAYPILVSAFREGWTRAHNMGEFSIDPFSEVFQHKDIYSMVLMERFDFWVLQMT